MSLEEQNKKTLEKLEAMDSKVEAKEQVELAESFTIRDRLMRRLKSNTVKIPFKDDIGTFEIEVRLLSPGEQSYIGEQRLALLKFRQELNKIPIVTDPNVNAQVNIEQIKEFEKRGQGLLDELYKMVSEICVDKTLDFNYWKEGKGFNTDVPMTLLAQAVSASQKTESDTARFRNQ